MVIKGAKYIAAIRALTADHVSFGPDCPSIIGGGLYLSGAKANNVWENTRWEPKGGVKSGGGQGEVIRERKHNSKSVCVGACVCLWLQERHSDGEDRVKGNECPSVLPAYVFQALLPIRSLSLSLSLCVIRDGHGYSNIRLFEMTWVFNFSCSAFLLIFG